ncbi:MAG: class I SAM-dependent methyltransferase, partial [Bacteroidota bacterium]
YLLQDLWALGSSVDQIIDAVDTFNLHTPSVKILDLGCGKGALSVRLASKYRLKVVGIDAIPEFLDYAIEKAVEYNVSHLCEFIEDDILEFTSVEHDFDIVILASLGGIFGSLKDTIERLRSQVNQNGYVIIDDGFLKNKDILNRKGYSHYCNYKNSIKELMSFNDILIEEINTNEVSKEINHEYLEVIEKRSKELIDKHPELEKDLNEYIQLQKEECEIIETEIEGTIWVLRKL